MLRKIIPNMPSVILNGATVYQVGFTSVAEVDLSVGKDIETELRAPSRQLQGVVASDGDHRALQEAARQPEAAACYSQIGAAFYVGAVAEDVAPSVPAAAGMMLEDVLMQPAAAAVYLAEAAHTHGQGLLSDCFLHKHRELQCPWCDASSSTEKGIMLHIDRNHAGKALGEQALQFFRDLDRGICKICGKLRSRTAVRCSICRTSTAARAVAEGDVVPTWYSRSFASHGNSKHPWATASGRDGISEVLNICIHIYIYTYIYICIYTYVYIYI
jgi:hypothetical protein